MDKCPICNSPANIDDKTYEFKTYLIVNCYRCGRYEIEEDVIDYEIDNEKLSSKQIANISGWIRENQDILINSEKFKFLITIKTLSITEKADKILIYLSKEFPVAGTPLKYNFNKVGSVLNVISNQTFPESRDDPFMKMFNKNAPNLLPLISFGRIIDDKEFNFIWDDYLINEVNYISKEQKISPAGWAYLESLRQANPDSKKAFVAMWFTDEMKDICEKFIKKAAEDAGDYKAEPIIEKDYNGDINDEIIGEIRNSRFVIADFTGNRGGVYYEAGFAYGLNIPVIYTCREDWFNKFVKQSIKIQDSEEKEDDKELIIFSQIHFDINHHNFIIWKDGDDLYEQLVKRIKATIT